MSNSIQIFQHNVLSENEINGHPNLFIGVVAELVRIKQNQPPLIMIKIDDYAVKIQRVKNFNAFVESCEQRAKELFELGAHLFIEPVPAAPFHVLNHQKN